MTYFVSRMALSGFKRGEIGTIVAKTLLSIFILIFFSSFALAGESELLKIEKLIDQNMSKVYYISSNDGNPELKPIQIQE